MVGARSDGYLQARERHRRWPGNRLALVEAVFDVQPDGVLDVAEGFVVRLSLRIAALQFGAVREEAVLVAFDNNGEPIHTHR